MPDQDPFASIATPIQQAPPAGAPPAGGDPFASIATPVEPPKTGMQKLTGFLEEPDSDEDMGNIRQIASGAIKSGANLAGNILDLTRRYVNPTLHAMPHLGSEENYTRGQQHLADAADWLKSGGEPTDFWQNVGAVGEQALEYIGTDGLLKIAGLAPKAIKAGEVVSKGAQAAESLKGAQEVSGVLAKHPKLAGLVMVGLKASKDAITSGEAAASAAKLGAQTYLHTEDPEQAAIAAVTGGALHVGAAGVMAPLGKIASKTLKIGGEEVPALARQVTEAGKPVTGGAAEAPEIQAAQQQTMQNLIRNKARVATASVLGEINAGRGAGASPGVPQLPAPEGSKGFLFTIGEGAQGVEDPTGTLVQRAEKIPAGERTTGTATVSPQRGEMGPLAATVPGRAMEGPQAFKTGSATGAELTAGEQAQSAADQDTIERLGTKKATGKKLTADERSQLAQAQARESTARATTEPRGEQVRGGPSMQTPDPHEAEARLHRLEESLQEPGLSSERRAQIEAQHKTLKDQLGMYYSSPYANRFDPIDVNAATNQVTTFGGAAQQIRGAIQPIFDRISGTSKEAFNAAISEFYDARNALRNAEPGAAEDAAQARFDAANKGVDNMISLNKGAVSSRDLMTAKSAWGKSAKLDELHTVFERMVRSGVTAEETAQGYQTRVSTGNAKALQRWLDQGNNMMKLDQMIGPEGRQNLKDITLLLSNVNDARATMDATGAIRAEVAKKIGRAGTGAMAGAAAAHMLGQSPWYGAMVGATGEEGIRMILRVAAHDPQIGKMLTYAVKNKVAQNIYAPLIARAILTPTQSQAAPAEEQEQEGP